MKVFVYGTLMSGQGNNVLLKGSKYIGPHIMEGIKLFYAGFPVASPEENCSAQGELWEIDPNTTLKWLDRLEGEGRMYNRVEQDGIHFYIGHPGYWDDFTSLEECPKDNNNVYRWERRASW